MYGVRLVRRKRKIKYANLIVRANSRGRYPTLYGKKMRYVERRDSGQIKRAVYSVRYKRHVAYRLLLRTQQQARAKLVRLSLRTFDKFLKYSRYTNSYRASALGAATRGNFRTNQYLRAAKHYSLPTLSIEEAPHTVLFSSSSLAALPAQPALKVSATHALARRAPLVSTNEYAVKFQEMRARLYSRTANLYRKRIKLRLPNTNVSRARRRHAGRSLLLNTRSSEGFSSYSEQLRALLPPRSVTMPVQTTTAAKYAAEDLLSGKPLISLQARLWLRPAKRTQNPSVYWLRRRDKDQNKRFQTDLVNTKQETFDESDGLPTYTYAQTQGLSKFAGVECLNATLIQRRNALFATNRNRSTLYAQSSLRMQTATRQLLP